jgi:hypothetical protein
VNAVATDTAGNQTISAKVTIIKDATSPVKPSGATTTVVNNPPGGTGGTGGDTTAPNVVITGPSNGAWTGNSIDVSASATDNVGLATLKFFGNGTQFAQVSCSGMSCASTQLWLTGPLRDGKHTITVVATDTAGNSTVSAPVVINK